ncbi:MAG: GDP-mannose 4,6-dehydratase [Nanoarchaeota archaeon]|nr:GDP-mannose 4,6-dehydratase [Nanoarchaeota archaeon]
MKKALITGINGFIGSHLADYLLKKDYKVFGTIRKTSNTEKIEHIKDKIKLKEVELTDAKSVYEVLNDTKPSEIYHLASYSNVKKSWEEPREVILSNSIGTINLFEAVRKLNINPSIQIAGSSEEYGLSLKDGSSVKETAPLKPLSPYAVSKVFQDMLSFQYSKTYGVKSIVTRGFNHTGPRRDGTYVVSSFSKQIVMIEKGLQEPVMTVGNLEVQRDFSDVRDVVRAYHLLLQKIIPGESYNICSGKAYSIKEILDMLLSLSNAKIKIKSNPKKMRSNDTLIMNGSYEKLHKQTGWKPEIPFEKTLRDLLDYWREKIK